MADQRRLLVVMSPVHDSLPVGNHNVRNMAVDSVQMMIRLRFVDRQPPSQFHHRKHRVHWTKSVPSSSADDVWRPLLRMEMDHDSHLQARLERLLVVRHSNKHLSHHKAIDLVQKC